MTDRAPDDLRQDMPIRLRLSRAKGFNLQALSHATNGLPAVNVARPSMWGNYAGPRMGLMSGQPAVNAFKAWIEAEASWGWRASASTVLSGRNLACWCTIDAPCHADLLLELANATPARGSDE